jgi:hypothetical protein
MLFILQKKKAWMSFIKESLEAQTEHLSLTIYNV